MRQDRLKSNKGFTPHLREGAGFTLIEILIAIAILSTAIVFLFRSFAASLSAISFSQNITLACYLTENNIWEIAQMYKEGLAFQNPGTEELEGKDFNWNYDILNTDSGKLKKLRLNLSWKEARRGKDYSMEFLNYLAAK